MSQRIKIFGFILITVALMILAGLTWLGMSVREIYFSCEWHGQAIAWVDENRNRELDAGEPPLESVEFKIEDILNNVHPTGVSISDRDGVANVGFSGGGTTKLEEDAVCDLEVYATPPAGYTQLSKRDDGERIYFGFVPDSDTPKP